MTELWGRMEMDTDEKTAEERFFEAFLKYAGPKPVWFRDLKIASHKLDYLGLDIFILATHKDDEEEYAIPLQLKGSEFKKEEYYETHREAKGAGIEVYVVPFESNESICQRFFTLVEEIRQTGRRFDDYINRLQTTKLPSDPSSGSFRKRVDLIKKRCYGIQTRFRIYNSRKQ